MPRRLKLSPLQRGIVWTLEEAGTETVECVIATVGPSDRYQFEREVDELKQMGLVAIESSEHGAELVLTEKGYEALRK